MQSDDVYLVDILNSSKLILNFTSNWNKDEFLADPKTQSAVLHQLLLIGEAAKRLSPDFIAKHSDIPWRKMAGMRNKLIHEYNDVDIDQVWRIVESDIPGLIQFLETIFPART